MKKNSYVLKDKNSIYIDDDVVIGDNVIIYENNRIESGTIIEDNVTIYPNSFIKGSIIKKGTKIYSSFIELAEIGECSQIGPFSCIRKKTKLGANVIVSSFCEVKESKLGSHIKIGSYSKIVNANIGDNSKVGSGVIFEVSKKENKGQFIIGRNVNIGAGSHIILPVKVYDNAVIECNSLISKDVLNEREV